MTVRFDKGMGEGPPYCTFDQGSAQMVTLRELLDFWE